MVVDDEPSMARLLGELLGSAGCDTRVFTSSEQALDAFLADPQGVDLIVTDQTMPVLTGIDLARSVHQTRADVPVILCSGYRESLTDAQLDAARIHTVLDKPVQVEELLDRVARELDVRARGS